MSDNDHDALMLGDAFFASMPPGPAVAAPSIASEPLGTAEAVAPAIATPAAHERGAPSTEEMAMGLVGLPPAPSIEAPASAAKPRRVVRFIEAEREKVVPLAHPVECDNVVYERIAVRRLNVADYREHFAKPDGERGLFPCFFDARGETVPEEVLDALSLDDSNEVHEAYNHFLPASFRADPAA